MKDRKKILKRWQYWVGFVILSPLFLVLVATQVLALAFEFIADKLDYVASSPTPKWMKSFFKWMNGDSK